jgi:hypothetical protein
MQDPNIKYDENPSTESRADTCRRTDGRMDGHDEANRSGRALFYVRGYSLHKYFGIPDFLGQEGHLCNFCIYCVKRRLPHGREVTYSDRAWKNMLPLLR